MDTSMHGVIAYVTEVPFVTFKIIYSPELLLAPSRHIKIAIIFNSPILLIAEYYLCYIDEISIRISNNHSMIICKLLNTIENYIIKWNSAESKDLCTSIIQNHLNIVYGDAITIDDKANSIIIVG